MSKNYFGSSQPTLICRSSRRKKEERKLAVEVEFVPAPPQQQSGHLQQKKQRVNSGQKEIQAVPKVDLADDTENEVGLATFQKQLINSSQRFS